MKQQQGFTLIELIVVIVILGILAATAMPKFVNLSVDADTAAIQGVAGALASAGSINYAQRSITATAGYATSGVSCSTLATNLLEGGTPTGFTITGNAPGCSVAGSKGGTAASAVVVSIS